MSDETQTTPESVQEGTSGGLNARNDIRVSPDPSEALRGPRRFTPGGRVRVAEDARCLRSQGCKCLEDARGGVGSITYSLREGQYRLLLDGEGFMRIIHADFLTLIDPDQTPDLPVIAFEDIKPGMTVEIRDRATVNPDGLWRFERGDERKFHLVSTPPDPDAELAEQVASLMSVSIEDGMTDIELAREVIALVDEHRAGSDEQ